MSHVGEARERLALDCNSSAEWRARKADEYPDDLRNRTSAVALETAARDILALPDDDPRLRHLADVAMAGGNDAAAADYIEEASRLIGRHGFSRGDTQTTDDLLAELVRVSSETLRRSFEHEAALDERVD